MTRNRKPPSSYSQEVHSLIPKPAKKRQAKRPAEESVGSGDTPQPSTPYGRYLTAMETTDCLQMQEAFLEIFASDQPLPDEMRNRLAIAFEYLCAGVADPLLAPVKRRGGREEPLAKHMQKAAIRYLRWCEDKRFVANAYGVSIRTIERWIEEWRDKPIPPFADGFPDEERKYRIIEKAGEAYKRKFQRARRTK